MTVRTLRGRIDRLEARRANDHAPPDPFAIFLGIDRAITLAELLDAAGRSVAPPHDPTEPTPNVIDVDAYLARLDDDEGPQPTAAGEDEAGEAVRLPRAAGKTKAAKIK